MILVPVALACAEPTVPGPAPAAVGVDLAASGFSPRYRAHVSDPVALRALGEALAACTAGPVALDVSYAASRGVATLSGPWDARCRPTPTGDLAPVQPLGRALAGWRDALAVAHDPRLASFTCRIDLGDGCVLALVGQLPPDGSTFAACPGCPVAATLTEAGCVTGSGEGRGERAPPGP